MRELSLLTAAILLFSCGCTKPSDRSNVAGVSGSSATSNVSGTSATGGTQSQLMLGTRPSADEPDQKYDSFGLPLVITVEAPEPPQEILGPLPPVVEK
jgi:hypothetical protein